MLFKKSTNTGPYAGFWLGGFFTLRWTFPDLQQTATHSPMADLELGGIAHSQIVSVQNALLGGSEGMPPRKILDFKPSEIVSGAVSGQNC